MKFGTLIYFLLIIISFSPKYSFENVTRTSSDDQQQTISLKNYNQTESETQAFTKRSYIPIKENVTFSITDIPKIVAFMIVQIHTFGYNVSISHNRDSKTSFKEITYGTNIGLYIDTSGKTSIEIFVKNHHTKIVQALFAVVPYTSEAPIPGGCNMEFYLEISPFQKLVITDAIVIVDAEPSSSPEDTKRTCNKSLIKHEAYRLYLPAQDYSSESYFSAIEKMLTPEDIIKNAQKIPAPSIGPSLRRVYSAYSRIGSTYAMVATYKNKSAAYVPNFSYACNTLEIDGCSMLSDAVSKTTCVFILFLGVYLLFVGHLTPNVADFIISCLGGGLIGYICAIHAGTHTPSSTMWIAIGSGLVTASLWKILTCCLSDKASRLFPILFFAFFCSCIVYYKLPDRILPLENGFFFWGFFCSLTFLMFTLIYIISCMSSIMYCAVLGSYLMIIAFDYYLVSTLKYIIINIVRRITVPNFNVAVIAPPYGTAEMILTIFWVFLALASVFIQVRSLRRRMNGSGVRSIRVASIDNCGSVTYTPWREIYRQERLIRRSLRDDDSGGQSSRCCNIL